METWMINVVVIIGGGIAVFAMIRLRVTRLEKDFESHINQSDNRTRSIYDKISDSTNKCSVRLDACFRRADMNSEKITILERDTSNLLDLPTAEAKFVTRKELELHLEKIEIITSNTNDKVADISGKQDDIIKILNELNK